MVVLNNADAIYLGSQAVDSAYLGAQQVWGSSTPWTPASLFADSEAGAWYATSPWYQAPDGVLPATENPNPVGRVDDRSGNGHHATQATVPARPVIPAAGLRLRSDFVDDKLQVAADTGASEALVNTPYGHYRARMAGAFRLPLNDATGIIVRDGITPEQQAEVATYFGTPEVLAVFMSPDTSVTTNMRTLAAATQQFVRCIGANGVEVVKALSRFGQATINVSADGLTAPVAFVFETNATLQFICNSNQLTGNIPDLSINAALQEFNCNSNQLTGSVPDLSVNTALQLFHCGLNQLTGNLPDLPANTAMQQFNCSTNQITGSIPGLSANTALQQFNCNSNQITGSIPDLSKNTELQQFQCQLNQLTGSIPDLSTNIVLKEFVCYSNQLTGWEGGTLSSTLGSFQAHNNQLTVEVVDALLAAFVAAGRTSASGICTLLLNGSGNATPSVAGLADRAILVSRGWNVNVN